MIRRSYRLDRWLKLSAELMGKLPPDYRAHILAELEKYGRHQLAEARIVEFKSVCKRRLPRDWQFCLKLIVILLGAFTFRSAPQQLAIRSEIDESIAQSIGFVAGATAAFFTHASAAEVLTGVKLKQGTRSVRKAVQNDLSIGEQP